MDRGRRSKVLKASSIEMIVQRRNPSSPGYGQGIGVSEFADGWPQVIMYCGGTKCSITCNRMHLVRPETAVVISVYSNHMHLGFPTKKDFEAYETTTFMNDADDSNANISVQTAGGAEELPDALLAVYKQSKEIA
ncbi:hypothetical protein P43SY_010784 [Pythium insidiosum]|uniref:Uncharacterized protein n=1 Tax=Pythium insidiosum TaxID=114742 RepID=A0AAD5L8F9_PYTIN|nr:hypothetical protein P43SY_010784 [Pythium insidiosum]